MNKYLFELLGRVEESARRLAATIMNGNDNNDKRLRDIALVEVEVKEISDALEAFKSEIVGGITADEARYSRLIRE